MTKPTCQAAAKRGPCRAFALPDGAYCWTHDERRAADVHAARVRGAVKTNRLRSILGRVTRLDTAGGLIKFNETLIRRLLTGELESDTVRTAVSALSLQRQLIEASDVGQRVERLETLVTTLVDQGEERRRRWA